MASVRNYRDANEMMEIAAPYQSSSSDPIGLVNQFNLNNGEFAMHELNLSNTQANITVNDDPSMTALNLQTPWSQFQGNRTSEFPFDFFENPQFPEVEEDFDDMYEFNSKESRH